MGVTNLDDLQIDDLSVDEIYATPGWDDLRVYPQATLVGAVVPTTEAGFRGNNAFKAVNFVHTQADEIQFPLQMPHTWSEGSEVFPHVHFSPWQNLAGSAAARFVMELFTASPFEDFPGAVATYTMTYTWAGGRQWAHLIANNAAGLSMTGKTVSTVSMCRLYRDNTVPNNFAGKLTMLYVDVHYKIDRPYGSRQEYVK